MDGLLRSIWVYRKASWVYRRFKRYIPKGLRGMVKFKFTGLNNSGGDNMDIIGASVKVRNGTRMVTAKARKVRFSAHRFFTGSGRPEEVKALWLLCDYLCSRPPALAVYGRGPFLEELLKHAPALKQSIKYIIDDNAPLQGVTPLQGGASGAVPVIRPDSVPREVRTVFLAETRTARRWHMKKKLNSQQGGIEAVSPDIIADIGRHLIPAHAWVNETSNIYPIDIPEIAFKPGLDMALIDSPSRNMAFMPNGLAYVSNALKKAGVSFQTVDLDIIAYHRYHVSRLFDAPDVILTPDGNPLPEDPWLAENYELWQRPDTLEYFRPMIDETVRALAEARPKIVGFSIQACNVKFAKEVAKGVKALLPDTLILAGGYSCYQPFIGRLAFPEADYMMIGEADLNVGGLVRRLSAGERPTGLPGVISRFDPPDTDFRPGPMPKDLDALDMPRYDWYGIDVYRNHNHYQLTPIIASRGCRWSKCKFCAERFFWRIRSPKNVVDEFEYLSGKGCDLFMFNESDLNGMPEALLEICDEIIRRRLTIKLTGQLRIHKNSDRAFFDKLKEAGFVSLRFGVDAWAENTLRLQLKGYTLGMITQNLRDCLASGIYTEVNIVLGVPGETDDDITQSIELIEASKPYIGRVANINPLMLMSGSVYWESPEEHGIRFRGDKQEILTKHQHMVPDNMWFSENPYIDEKVRRQRFERVVMELHKRGFDVGPFAKQVIKDVLEGKGAGASARPGAQPDGAAQGAKKGFFGFAAPGPAEKKLHVVKFSGGFYGIDGGALDAAEAPSLFDSNVLEVKRENPANIRLITEGYASCYNIIKVEGAFYGIRQGYPFDINMAEAGGYEPGVCFRGRTIKDVEDTISSSVSARIA
ncbi:MAG: radical SAM protein [Deltaproteobacteria bacterium]|nr:radical SAM protein [Deltaproteobacteria bacterium]